MSVSISVLKEDRVAIPIYLAAIAGAEVVTSLSSALNGILVHIGILVALIVHYSLVAERPVAKLILAMSLAPLVRILSLSMPLVDFSAKYWYALTGSPLLISAAIVARILNFHPRDIGLTWGNVPLQLAIGSTGFAFGVIEYFILHPLPIIDSFNWEKILFPAFILMVFTGFAEELIFRGILQKASLEAMGQRGIILVSLLFAILHLGHLSVLDMVFVFFIALFFSWIVKRTGSLLGVSLSHGIINIILYLVVPFLVGYHP